MKVFPALRSIICILLLPACLHSTSELDAKKANVADKMATYETKALLFNLKKLSPDYLLFGQEDATAYGIGWKNEDLRSDINDVCGSFPSVYGWDLGKIGHDVNIDSVAFDRIKFWIKSAYERGGINTISFHMDNPVTGGNAWDTTRAVAYILPGGSKHEFYKAQLKLVANFLLDLKSKNGAFIPIIFRPFHEQNGTWFWWGSRHATAEEYIALYRFTVSYLRDVCHVHNVLYAYAPDIFKTSEHYMEYFPGEDYVDVLGFDNYGDFSDKKTVNEAIKQLRIVVKLAEKMNKIAALTETGKDCVKDSMWWTQSLLNPIKNDSVARKIAWALVWRNARTNHHFGPYPGHPSAGNFIAFESDPFTLFEADLPPMYTFGK